MSKKTGDNALYIVATPIGNLADLSRRATEILQTADVLVCEDTRHSGKLLRSIGVLRKPKLIAYHDHSIDKVRQKIVRLLEEGNDVALISDAGTPLISDPGYRLVSDAIEAGVRIVPIPGASAVIAALSVAGLPTDNFSFLGFAPHKSRSAFTQELQALPGTVIFYESPERIADMLQRLAKRTPERRCVIARELTKLHEEILRGTVASLAEDIAKRTSVKGEITVLLAPLPTRSLSDAEIKSALAELSEGESLRSAVDKVAATSGENRRRIYQLALSLKDDHDGKDS